MSGAQDASKANAYAALGPSGGATASAPKIALYLALTTFQDASKANAYPALGVGTGGTASAAKAVQYVALAAPGYPLGTLRRQRERTFPRGFRKYPRLDYMLDWKLGR